MLRDIILVISILSLSTACGSSEDHSVHVAANARADGDGTVHAPYQTLVQARDAVRAARKTGKLKAGDKVNIVIGAGDYRWDNTFELGADDGGTAEAPVVYSSQVPGAAYIHGGVTLAAESFKPVTAPNILSRIDPSVRGKVLVCDLSALGKFDPFKVAFQGVPTGPWLYMDSVPMTLARWPNIDAATGGWATFSKAVDTGLPQAGASDPAMKKPHPGSFIFEDPRPARWNIQEGVWLFGYWTHDWADEVIRVASYDKDKQIIKLAAPHGYGIKGKTWGPSKRRFFALNLLEELDAPGEWYLDRMAKRLYFYPPKPLNRQSIIVLASLSQTMMKLNGTKNVKFTGLRFEYSHSHGIVLQNTENVEIAGCVVANLAGDGITVNGKANTVRSCDLFHLGMGGVMLNGGDRKILEPAGNLVINNHIHHYGLFKRTYAPGIGAQGCGQIVRNNRIHDAPHNAILYGGNEHRFELNDVYRVVMETGDAGAFYTGRDWTNQGNIVRNNFIHDLGHGGSGSGYVNTMGVYLDDCVCGNTVEGNIFLRAGRAIMVGGGRDNPIWNNVMVDCPIGLHIDSRGMTWKNWNDPADPSWCFEEKAKRLNYTQPPWSTRYPRLAAMMKEEPRLPLNNPVRRNVFVDCGKQVCDFDAGVKKLLDRLEIADNLTVNTSGTKTVAAAPAFKGFASIAGTSGMPVDLGCKDIKNGDCTLRAGSLLMRRLPSFKPVPFDKIGLFKDEYRRELPAHE